MTTIKLRRGTTAQWASANTILADGEPGLDTDTGLRKVGNGVLGWNALPYDGMRAPAVAGARVRPYDSASNIYGSAAARAQVRRALGRLYGSSRSSLVNLYLAGDSFTAGWRANTIGTDDWASLLIAQLRSAGFPVTGGWVHAANGVSPGDARWTFVGPWNRSDTTANYAYTSGTTTQTATFTSTEVGTILEVAAHANSATLLYSVDGGADQTWNLVANQVNILQITGLALGTHTVTVKRNGATTWLYGARVRTATGLSVSNGGIFGSHTTDWLPTAKLTPTDFSYLNPYKLSQTLCGGAPALVMLCLGHNDARHANYTLANMKANLGTIVAAYSAAGSTVLQRTYPNLVSTLAGDANSAMALGTPWSSFLQAMFDVSDTNDTALIDHHSVLGNSDTLVAQGLMNADNIHLTTPGQAALARADFRAIQAM